MIDIDRVLSHCKSKTHNTLAAATASTKGDRCICPHAVSLANEAKPNAYRAIGVPYFVYNDCPASTHNTLSSYYKRAGRGCRCPGAVILRNAYLKTMAAKKRKERASTGVPGGREGVAVIVESSFSTPRLPKEMMDGACRKPENLPIVDMGFSEAEKDRLIAKQLCWNECPIGAFEACGQYVRQEPGPGYWGGVYAGMDAHDRKASARVGLRV